MLSTLASLFVVKLVPFIVSSGAFVFVLGALVFVHEFGHFIVAKLVKVRVDVFSLGFGKTLWSFKKGDTEYRISMIPLGGYVKPAGENPEEERKGEPWEFLSKTPGERAAIIAAGPLFNYICAFLLLIMVYFSGVPNLTSTIGMVKENYPAATAGLKANDKIISVDGKQVKYWDELSAAIHAKTEEVPVEIQVQRLNEIFSISLIPQVETVKTLLGEDKKIALIGIGPSDDVEVIKYGFIGSISEAAKQVVFRTKMIFFALYQMICGKISPREMAGPVGIFQITGRAAQLGFIYLLDLMALLSINLAIINLFPIPVLDGGHLLFLAWEKIRGKQASLKVQEIATRIGFSMLMLLMVLVLFNDLNRIGLFEKIFSFFVK
ncbi:MAG: RIP metalloprotease RseP [Candidatus Omnitrophica bacterium]|nr:RIP metalloprotease RseP [Candidatus Omnitrophota bacterium]